MHKLLKSLFDADDLEKILGGGEVVSEYAHPWAVQIWGHDSIGLEKMFGPELCQHGPRTRRAWPALGVPCLAQSCMAPGARGVQRAGIIGIGDVPARLRRT